MELIFKFFIVNMFVLFGASSARIDEEGTRLNLRNEANDDGSIISYKQVPRTKISYGRSDGHPVGLSKEALRERLDSIVLLLTRLSDRMVAIETKQNHQTERIDTISYRLTKLDVQGEERKSQLNDVSTSLRHQQQQSTNQLTNIKTLVENIDTNIDGISSNAIEFGTKLDNININAGKSNEQRRKGVKLSTILATVFGVKSQTHSIQVALENVSTSLMQLKNSTNNLTRFNGQLVTREDLLTSMADVRQQLIQTPTLAYQAGPRTQIMETQSADCWELYHKRGKTKSGVYRIQPMMAYLPFFVYCDMETDGGGWTVFQRREDGSIDFTGDWIDYKHGFGNLAGEFWLGNEKLFQLTNHYVNELKIVLGDFSQKYTTASYSAFSIGPESESYSLKLLGQYSGDAGDSLSYHVGQKWSTRDVDNDAWPDQNCARDHSGAWWYRACETSNLNGQYLHGPVAGEHEYKGVYWYDFHGPQYSLWQTTMMIRRGGQVIKSNKPPPSLHTKEFDPDEDPLLVYNYSQ